MKDTNFWLSLIGSSAFTSVVTAFITRKKTNAEAKNLQYEGTNTHIKGTKDFMEVWQQSLDRLEGEINQLKIERNQDKEKIKNLYGKMARMERDNMVYLVCIRDHDIDFDGWMQNFKKNNPNSENGEEG